MSEAEIFRAQKLVTYIPDKFGTPDIIIATAGSASRERGVQTVTPLAESIPRTVQADIEDADYARLAKELLREAEFAEKAVLCCWHHDQLPSFAGAWGALGTEFLSPWNEEVFEIIFKFEFVPHGQVRVTRIIEPF